MRRGQADTLLDWLQLARCEGVGPMTFTALLERHRSVTAALTAATRQQTPGGGARRVPSRAVLLAELEALASLEGCLLTKADPAYPELLRSLADAPPALALRGDPELLDRPAVAVVGSRNASANGCAFARRLARELAAAGLVVVSGLARGHRHRGARGRSRRRRGHRGGDRRRGRHRLSAGERRP